MEFKQIYAYVLGELDCATGNEPLKGQDQSYYDGYGDKYQSEQNQGAEE